MANSCYGNRSETLHISADSSFGKIPSSKNCGMAQTLVACLLHSACICQYHFNTCFQWTYTSPNETTQMWCHTLYIITTTFNSNLTWQILHAITFFSQTNESWFMSGRYWFSPLYNLCYSLSVHIIELF